MLLAAIAGATNTSESTVAPMNLTCLIAFLLNQVTPRELPLEIQRLRPQFEFLRLSKIFFMRRWN
jgi:hypothetical protein